MIMMLGSGLFFCFWPCFPSSVQPPVLGRVLANGFFECFGVFRCDPEQRVVFVGPLLGENHLFNLDIEKEAIVHLPANRNAYR